MEVEMESVGSAVCEVSEDSAKREGSAEKARYSEIDDIEKTVSAREDSKNVPEAEDGDCVSVQILNWACQELTEYFAGTRTTFTVPLHLQGTEFQLKAWNALRSIPYGETRSYSEIAEMIGNPRACRAIGGANNKNPVMLFVPCHRVVGKNGALVGYTGGLTTKKYLLEMEQGNRFGDDSQSSVIRSRISDRKDFSEEIAETVPYHVNKDGEYTLKDYYALPDERRAELIDGVFYDMAAPTTAHQTTVGEIWFQIRSYIGGKDGKCIPFMSPVDIQLDCDDRTMVQPDIAVVCDKDKVIKCCVFGAPDLVIEVLSESSVMRDTVIKLAKYKNAGVREYWIVDMRRKKVLVYEFEKSEVPMLYGIDRQIPVGIFKGDCVIDFASVYKSVEMLGNQE